MAAADAGSDPFATAKANLRDNVKTLITVFGAVAGVLLAGTPFSGYGALEPWTAQWWTATGSLGLGVVLVGSALLVLLDSLHPALAYAKPLWEPISADRISRETDPELKHLLTEFDNNRVELLPQGINSLPELDKLAQHAFTQWKDSGKDFDRKAFEDRDNNLRLILAWSAFVRLRYRVAGAMKTSFALGFVALFFIGMFSLAVGTPKEKSGGGNVMLIGPLPNPAVVFIPVSVKQ